MLSDYADIGELGELGEPADRSYWHGTGLPDTLVLDVLDVDFIIQIGLIQARNWVSSSKSD